MSDQPRVLFVCRQNSGRSQIAEAYLKKLAGDRIYVESAGLEPAETVHPLVVEVMREEGFDLSDKKPQSVFELYKEGRRFSHIVTVCSQTEGNCPTYPGFTERWHVPFPDPSKVTGTREEQMAKVRSIRDMIKKWLFNPGADDFVSKARILE